MNSNNKSTPPLRQLTLNFGQSAPKTSECAECGMFYNPSDKRDTQTHNKYHRTQETSRNSHAILRYTTPLKNERVVREYADGSKCIVIDESCDSQSALTKARQLLDFVDTQLGIIDPCSSNTSATTKKTTTRAETTKYYLYVASACKEIVGVCVAEQIEQAHRILYMNAHQSVFGIDEASGAVRAACGINRIWVASDWRRKGIASRLLDCVRLNFYYIYELEASQLAFSDPTQFGRLLATKYCKTSSFLVYNLSTTQRNN